MHTLIPRASRRATCVVFGIISALVLPSCKFAPENEAVQYPSPLVLTELKVTLSRASLYLGEKTTATATGTDQFANPIATGAVTYASSNTTVATITSDGFVTALTSGYSTITATTATKHAETLLQVSAPSVLAEIHLAIPTQSVRQGFTNTVTLVAEDQYGALFVAPNVVWSSSAPSVATVSQNGVVTGIAIGQATITAQSGSVSGTTLLNVISAAPTVQSVVLNGAARVKVGDQYDYTPVITLSDGTNPTLPVTFGVIPITDGTITPTGHFTPLRIGTIGINATVSSTTFLTQVTAYDWRSLASPGSYSVAYIDSDIAVVRGGRSSFPSLIVSCSAVSDALTPELNFAIQAISIPGDTAGQSIQYRIDDGPTKNELWNGPSNDEHFRTRLLLCSKHKHGATRIHPCSRKCPKIRIYVSSNAGRTKNRVVSTVWNAGCNCTSPRDVRL